MMFLALSYSYSEQCWSYINNACPFWYDAVSLQLLPFVITPPLPKTGKHNWFLARSDEGKRLMIIRTHEPEKLYCKNPTVCKHREICEYPDSGCYVYEQDTSLLGRSGFFSWRRVRESWIRGSSDSRTIYFGRTVGLWRYKIEDFVPCRDGTLLCVEGKLVNSDMYISSLVTDSV